MLSSTRRGRSPRVADIGHGAVLNEVAVRVIMPAAALKHSARALAGDPKLTLVNSPDQPKEYLALAQELAPCVLIAPADAVASPNVNALSLLALGVRIIVIDKTVDEAKIKRYTRMGYSGVLNGAESQRFVKKAVRAVAKGEIWAGRRILSDLVRELARSENPRNLTPRETEILALITQGHNNREIAERLFVTRETIRWHVRSLYAKLGVRDRAHLRKSPKMPAP